jgi:hypothetical protein
MVIFMAIEWEKNVKKKTFRLHFTSNGTAELCSSAALYQIPEWGLEPILRLQNLQRQRRSRLEYFFKVEENIFVFRTH